MECSKRTRGLKQHAIEKIVEDDSSKKAHATEGEWAEQKRQMPKGWSFVVFQPSGFKGYLGHFNILKFEFHFLVSLKT